MLTLNIVFQNLKPIQKLSLKLKRLNKINQFRNIKLTSIFKTYSKQKLFTVLKSPHVNKKAREQFIFKTYKQNVIFTLNKINQLFNLIIFLKKKFSKETKLQFKIKTIKKKPQLKKPQLKKPQLKKPQLKKPQLKKPQLKKPKIKKCL